MAKSVLTPRNFKMKPPPSLTSRRAFGRTARFARIVEKLPALAG